MCHTQAIWLAVRVLARLPHLATAEVLNQLWHIQPQCRTRITAIDIFDRMLKRVSHSEAIHQTPLQNSRPLAFPRMAEQDRLLGSLAKSRVLARLSSLSGRISMRATTVCDRRKLIPLLTRRMAVPHSLLLRNRIKRWTMRMIDHQRDRAQRLWASEERRLSLIVSRSVPLPLVNPRLNAPSARHL